MSQLRFRGLPMESRNVSRSTGLVERLSTTWTWFSGFSISASTKWLPMKPKPPVTRIVGTNSSDSRPAAFHRPSPGSTVTRLAAPHSPGATVRRGVRSHAGRRPDRSAPVRASREGLSVPGDGRVDGSGCPLPRPDEEEPLVPPLGGAGRPDRGLQLPPPALAARDLRPPPPFARAPRHDAGAKRALHGRGSRAGRGDADAGPHHDRPEAPRQLAGLHRGHSRPWGSRGPDRDRCLARRGVHLHARHPRRPRSHGPPRLRRRLVSGLAGAQCPELPGRRGRPPPPPPPP